MTPTEFFYEHAGWSYIPHKETEEEGRLRGARELAEAELKAEDDFDFLWQEDSEIDSSDFSDETPWTLWECRMVHHDGSVVQSLHGIDFGRDKDPWGDSYKRVVEAELALQHYMEDAG